MLIYTHKQIRIKKYEIFSIRFEDPMFSSNNKLRQSLMLERIIRQERKMLTLRQEREIPAATLKVLKGRNKITQGEVLCEQTRKRSTVEADK